VLGDLGSPEAIILELSYLGAANRRLALLVDAGRLRLSDAFKLALAAKVRLEFGEHTEMSRKHLPATVPVHRL